jgi:hypothetical protein
MRPVIAALLLLLVQAEGPGDSSRIEAFYAGQFKEALRKSVETRRMLLIKGVSVILDEPAARDLKRGTC